MVCPDSWVRDEVAGRRGTGRSLLHHAAWAGDLEIFKVLVTAGADVGRRRTVAWRPNGGVQGRGSTPLHHAVMYNRLDIVQFLVKHCSVDINEPGEQGYTALHLAAKFDYPAVAEMLLLAGARTDLITRDEKTVWDLARGQQDRSSHAQVGAVMKLLEKIDGGGNKRERLLPLSTRPRQGAASPSALTQVYEPEERTDSKAAAARLAAVMAGSDPPQTLLQGPVDDIKVPAKMQSSASARLVAAMSGTQEARSELPAQTHVTAPKASTLLVEAMGKTAPKARTGRKNVAFADIAEPASGDSLDAELQRCGSSNLLARSKAVANIVPAQPIVHEIPRAAQPQQISTSLGSLSCVIQGGALDAAKDIFKQDGQKRRISGSLEEHSRCSGSTRSSTGSDLSSLPHSRHPGQHSAFHDPTSSSQNVGNHIGERSCIRQSKLFRMYESGNAAKAILGQDSLQWNVNLKEGAYHGQVFDAYEGRGRAIGAADRGREVGGPRRLGKCDGMPSGMWTTSSGAYGAGT